MMILLWLMLLNGQIQLFEPLIGRNELAGCVDQCPIEIENEGVEDALTHAGLLARIM